jgi:hypothetical protein
LIIAGNGIGLAFGSGGSLLSFGNNAGKANGANGAFSGVGRAATSPDSQRLGYPP